MNGLTALITGPTSGIGEQFAFRLSKEGYNLVLVSRNMEKLKSLSEKLSQDHGIQAQFVAADLSNLEAPQAVFEATNKLGVQVDVLINNAGFEVYAPFVESDWQATQNLLSVNVNALAKLTHLYLPGMLQRGSGNIINIGSIGSFIPGPNNAVYAATKAFVLSFSEAIAEELRGSGVYVTCLCPGAVDTPFADKADINGTPLFKYTAMKPEAVAEAGLNAMRKTKRVDVPGWLNKSIVFLQRFVPRNLLTYFSKRAMEREES